MLQARGLNKWVNLIKPITGSFRDSLLHTQMLNDHDKNYFFFGLKY